ncbi:MAG: SLC13 family permease [Lachnospiraceae bacterium]|nr:SLC13 family permease [Lachnospiraceae bacterium]
MNTMTICIIIFVLSLISYGLNKIPMAITSLLTLILLMLTGCIDTETALGGFANTNTVVIVGMFIIAAGLNRTRFVDNMSQKVVKLAGGSFRKAYIGYIILAALLTSFLTSPMVAFAVVFPLAFSMCEEFQVSSFKVMFPLVVVCIGCCGILPFGSAVMMSGQFNGFLETYGFAANFTPMTFTIGRLPAYILIILWAIFIAPKFAPDKPIVPISMKETNKAEKTPLHPFSEAMGYIIFFVSILCFFFGKNIGIANWQVCFIGALLLVVCRTLTEREAINAMPISIAMIYVGALAMGNALNATGAGTVIGNWLSSIVGDTQNNYLIGALFFILPFLMTQVMLNQAVQSIFVPICLLTCQAVGANPTGLLCLISAGCLTAYMTPMATPAIPMAMGAGGYDLKSLVKQSWPVSIVLALAYIFYTMTIFPAF